jgi:hypothetical protein
MHGTEMPGSAVSLVLLVAQLSNRLGIVDIDVFAARLGRETGLVEERCYKAIRLAGLLGLVGVTKQTVGLS